MPKLIAPTASLEAAWRKAHAEWGPGVHEDGFGLRPGDDVETAAGFAAWLRRLASDAGCTYRWIVDDGQVLGGIALRHGDGEAVQRTGHIGYGIRPSARRQGHAAEALRAMLAEARRQGLNQVVLICGRNNSASARTIERAGGTLAGNDDGGRLRRYLINTRP
ncbi:GNAT family N-acetyltransferase [Arthrobacter yangruifuii]|uniref:GNAT family N-acetyltransferase n=1 Tax=Arthrobacter yangruifuii TaxID=2606616 RepID=A0A5N6MS22_9MICC|nr:GNAT family N-acetyltransferase [Arthrobacter yangruifuii]KAD4059894.1 GNAT family N-acetyltransferase [Arthrobacter yangruifuii]